MQFFQVQHPIAQSKGISDLLVGQPPLRAEWRCATMDSGEQSVTMRLVQRMLSLHADIWDLALWVIKVLHCSHCGWNVTNKKKTPNILLGATARCCSAFGQGTGSIVLDNVGCTGSEGSLFDCPHNGLNNHNCIHFEDVGVVCSSKKSHI